MTVAHGLRRSGDLELDCAAKAASNVSHGFLALVVIGFWTGHDPLRIAAAVNVCLLRSCDHADFRQGMSIEAVLR